MMEPVSEAEGMEEAQQDAEDLLWLFKNPGEFILPRYRKTNAKQPAKKRLKKNAIPVVAVNPEVARLEKRLEILTFRVEVLEQRLARQRRESKPRR